jgi:Ras-related protein Rab-21
MSSARFKVVLLGEGRVGKTSLLLRYVKDSFDDRQVSTIQASYLEKRLNLGNKTINLAIWDTAGQERLLFSNALAVSLRKSIHCIYFLPSRFHALGPIYYRDANGALLVYDITDKESFAKVKNWVKELRKIVGEDIELCIAGNKCDLEKQRQVNEDEAEAYAASVGAVHYKVRHSCLAICIEYDE